MLKITLRNGNVLIYEKAVYWSVMEKTNVFKVKGVQHLSKTDTKYSFFGKRKDIVTNIEHRYDIAWFNFSDILCAERCYGNEKDNGTVVKSPMNIPGVGGILSRI